MSPTTIIGIQGAPGSTNEKAAHFFAEKHGWHSIDIKYLLSTDKVLSALTHHYIDEATFHLDHALLHNSDIDRSRSVRVYSHPQALSAHRSFLIQQFEHLQLIPEIDTAMAAKHLQSHVYPPNSLVIAPIGCAEQLNFTPAHCFGICFVDVHGTKDFEFFAQK